VIAAAADATVSTVREDEVSQNAADVGDYLVERLEAELGDEVREIRGDGLMVGIEVKRGAMRYLKQLAMGEQLLALPAGRTVVRLLPPLTIDRDQADDVVDSLVEVIA
jgi:acetylornithine/LysW-gamma-L-lysine aminotransferase